MTISSWRRLLTPFVLAGAILAILPFCGLSIAGDKPPASAPVQADEFNLVVMDPLALPLSCPCVKGYAQRDYDRLGEYLHKALGKPVRVVYAESLSKAAEKLEGGQADLIIGKRSVVEHDLAALKIKGERLAALTGKDGLTTQSGLIVVPSGDPAKTAAGLQGYRIIFGPADCDEKHKAALAVIKGAGVKLPAVLETSASCSDGATIILELKPGAHGAAVISSYAKPLLEGCGTIKKGDLRVVAETAPVPFITAFLTGHAAPLRDKVEAALFDVADDAALCVALETQAGFVEPDAPDELDQSAARKKK